MNHVLKIVETADGSNTIYNAEVGESYHSKHGALQESRHVFLNSGLVYFLEEKQAPSESSRVGETFLKSVSILEVGFGTGLNFLLSADYCTANDIYLDYTGIEPYPLSREMISQTGYEKYVSPITWNNFIQNNFTRFTPKVTLTPNCQLQIASCQLRDFRSELQYDVIYFDAFAVAYQTEMWDDAAIGHAIKFLKPDGVFVTYAITGNLKRALKALGCKVEKVKGAAGKREMLRAVKETGI